MGVVAVVLVALALILQSVLFRTGTIRLEGLVYETYPTLAITSLGFLLASLILSLIGMRGWNKTLPAVAFILIACSIIFWAIMFYLGSN